MSNGRTVWRATNVAAWATIALATGALAQQPPPLLEDPTSGASVKLEPVSVLTHLVFFATWCPPCRDELPRLAEIEARWSDRGYRLIVVAVQSRHDRERLARFVADEAPPGRLLFDATGRAQEVWRAESLPTHVLLDAEGREILRREILGAEIETELQARLAAPRGGRRR